MKSVRQLTGGALRVVAEYLMVFPLIFALGSISLTAPMLYICAAEFLVFALLGYFTRRLIKIAFLQFATGIALCFAMSIFLWRSFGDPEQVAGMMLPLISAPLVFYRGKQHAQNNWNIILPTYAPCTIMIINLIILALSSNFGNLQEFTPVITAVGPFSLITSFFVMNIINRKNLAEDYKLNKNSTEVAVSRGMGAQNITILSVLMVLGLVMSGGPSLLAVARFVMRAIKYIMNLIGMFFSMVFTLDEVNQDVEPDTAEEGFIEYQAPNPFWGVFFNVILYIVSIGLIIFFAVIIFKVIRNAVRLLIGIIRQFMEQRGIEFGAGGDFEDTKERNMDMRELPKKYLRNLLRRARSLVRREAKWNDYAPEREKIRFLYRHSLRRAAKGGYKHNRAFTPREALGTAVKNLPQLDTIKDGLTQQYNIVRYSEHEPAAGTAKEYKNRAGL